MKARRLVALGLLSLLALPGTARPADAPEIVIDASTIAGWLVGGDGPGDLLVGADIRLNSARKTLTITALQARCAGGRVVFATDYDGAPTTLASELSEAASAAAPEATSRDTSSMGNAVPADAAARRSLSADARALAPLILPDSNRIKADGVARVWVDAALAPAAGQRVAVVLLLTDEAQTSVLKGTAAKAGALMVLIRYNGQHVDRVRVEPLDDVKEGSR